MSPLTVSAPAHQSLVKTVDRHTNRQIWWRSFLSQSSLFSSDSSLYKTDDRKKKKEKKKNKETQSVAYMNLI